MAKSSTLKGEDEVAIDPSTKDEDPVRWEEHKAQWLRFTSDDDNMNSKDEAAYKTPRLKKYGKLSSKRPQRSLIRKEGGQSTVVFKGVRSRTKRYLKDFFVSLLEMRWLYVIIFFLCASLTFYTIFGVGYYFIAWFHGDFDNLGNPHYMPCIENLEGMLDAFLFSLETQTTLGYGTIYAHAECGAVIPIIYLQVAGGFLFDTMLFGFIFSKLSRPKFRRHTLLFSRDACVVREDGELVLQIRVGDIHRAHLIDTRVHAAVIRRHTVPEKYSYPLYQHQLEFESHEMKDRLFLLWPLILVHRINQTSPLWTVGPKELKAGKFEIVVFLEGYIESTGMMCQARTSYTTKEILWGHRFTRLEEYDIKNDLWVMDFVRFNQTVPSPIPEVSACELANQDSAGAELTTAASTSDVRRSNTTLDDDNDLFDTASEAESEEIELSRIPLLSSPDESC